MRRRALCPCTGSRQCHRRGGLRPEPSIYRDLGNRCPSEGRRLADEHVHRRTNGGLYPVDGGRYDPGRRQRRAGRCKVHQGRQHRLCVAGGADCRDHEPAPTGHAGTASGECPGGLQGSSVRCDRPRHCYHGGNSPLQRHGYHPFRRHGVSGVGGCTDHALSHPQPRHLSGSAARHPSADVGR